MHEIEVIKNYVNYLKRECRLMITIHFTSYYDGYVPSELMCFNIHENSYCVYTKTCRMAQEHCIEKQSAVASKASSGSFIGTCHAGVTEFVYPIIKDKSTLGFISVSGYRAQNGESYVKKISEKYSFPYADLLSSYSSLKEDLPEKEWVDTLLNPLVSLIELALLKSEASVPRDESFLSKLVRYLKRHHTEEVSSETICEALSCSRSKLSHVFNKEMGMSIREYISSLRIEDAKSLLSSSDLSVTEIALSVGFEDTNYFTQVFKRAEGITPSQYKKKIKESSAKL